VKVGNFPKKDRDRLIRHVLVAQESGKEVVWLRSRSEVVDYLQKMREEMQKEQRQPIGATLAGK
jgi:hypothetical protein